MKNLFKHSSSSWVRYSKYECKKDKNNKYYITPAPVASRKSMIHYRTTSPWCWTH